MYMSKYFKKYLFLFFSQHKKGSEEKHLTNDEEFTLVVLLYNIIKGVSLVSATNFYSADKLCTMCGFGIDFIRINF